LEDAAEKIVTNAKSDPQALKRGGFYRVNGTSELVPFPDSLNGSFAAASSSRPFKAAPFDGYLRNRSFLPGIIAAVPSLSHRKVADPDHCPQSSFDTSPA
jgi:hypothetical protein